MGSRFPPRFEDYADAIAALPERDRLLKTDLLVERFRVFRDEHLEIYYAPFDFVNTEAKVALVGITPGWTQMEIAFRQARAVLRNGGTAPEVLRRAKSHASFAGQTRSNLVTMLDEIGLQGALGVKSCNDLFGSSNHLVHTTSAVRNPVFVHGQNYTGHSPDLLLHPTLTRYVKEGLATELTSMPEVLVVPLGKCVDAALRYLIQTGVLSTRRCLLGFPHPSGANGHRMAAFEQRHGEFVQVVEGWAGPT